MPNLFLIVVLQNLLRHMEIQKVPTPKRYSSPASDTRKLSFPQYLRHSARVEDFRRHTVHFGENVTISTEFLLFLRTARGRGSDGPEYTQDMDGSSDGNDRDLERGVLDSDPDSQLVDNPFPIVFFLSILILVL